jgi:2-polyprenyl-3-methyl-5-hydroxy-6-metoxy-1,4-benzoquinol methylase
MLTIRGVINPAWDNNAYCQPRLLRALPARCERVLDLGCGKGAFAIRLAERAVRVDAVDRSAEMIEVARRVVPGNVTCQLGDVAEMTLPDEAYDAITSISAFHHLSLPTVLPRLAQALRPGGVLIGVSHHRLELPRDLAFKGVMVFASTARRSVLLCLPEGRRYRRDMYRRMAVGPAMPGMDPQLTIREVRRQAERALPGVTVKRLALPRYELRWRKPER